MNITTKNFGTTLSGMLRSAKSQREKVQALIVFGLVHYADTKDAGYLSRVLNGCIGIKSMPTVTIKNYIKAHANVVWGKTTDGTYVFKKDGKDAVVELPSATWFNWEGAGHNNVKADVDALGQAKALLGRIKKGLADHKVKDRDEAKRIEAALATITA